MKRIPIWQHHPKTITPPELTLSTLHPNPYPQLHPIHIDSLHEILTTKPPDYPDYSTALQQQQSEGPWRGGCSVVHERRSGRIVWLDFVVLGCLCVGEGYVLVVEDCVGRCVVVRYGVEQFVDRLKNTSKTSILNTLQQQPDNNLRPLRKQNLSLAQHKNKLYLAGSQPIHQWELTSPLWMYQLEQDQWTEVKMEGQGENEEWIVFMEGLVVCVGESYVRVRDVENKGRKECIVSLTTSNQPIIDTHTDTFLTCTHKHPQTGLPHLLMLIQTKSPDRQPLLLELSLPHPSQPKLNGHIANQQLNIEVVRYDLGVFLYEEGRLDRLEKGTLGNGLWEIVNQVVYMHVVETAASFVQHSMSSTSNSNFIKKKQQHSHKQTNKKVQLLTLYTKTRKNPDNSTPLIQLDTYQIKLSRLERIPLQAQNKPLSYYFQRKQYCDLVFFAQKREMHCSRQLFQFYSSKFKKLYSSSTRPQPPSSLSLPEKQTMVKLDHTKLSTIYFLVQHMYYNFALSTKQLDENTLIDLMILSHKFQVLEMQVLCEQEVEISCGNFNRLYDYFRNSETAGFRELFLRFFIIHAQDVIKIMPIGKVEELIRLVYSPECPHLAHTELKSKLQSTYTIKDPQTGEQKEVHRSINYAGIIKSQEVTLKICLKCNRLLAFNQQSHRKNKSSIRGSSLGDFGHKKKDNKSN